jgi:DNA-binding NarL/FixJ family response regulator
MTHETTGRGPDGGGAAKVRVVVADDHPMFRFGLVAALAGAAEIAVVGEAEDGAELLTLVARTDPDVVLTDLTMPRMDGATATARIRAAHPTVAVVVLTMHDDDEAVFAAMRSGASGYLLKGADRDDIVRAVLSVARGDAVYGPSVARRIVDFFTGTSRTYSAQVFPELTDREREVLDLIAAGHGNHEVARRLVLSEKTVRNHVSAILTKLQFTDRATAIVKARDAGLGRSV